MFYMQKITHYSEKYEQFNFPGIWGKISVMFYYNMDLRCSYQSVLRRLMIPEAGIFLHFYQTIEESRISYQF
jgi:hypothetical protein